MPNWFIPVATIILVGGVISGVVLFSDQTPNSEPAGVVETLPATITQDDDQPVPATEITMAAASYTDYSPAALAAAQAEGDDTVLFFHADWCPTCRAADGELTRNLDQIPEGVTILKTDYDSESELKKQFNVVSQHTFVQLDASGEVVTQWTGGSLDTILDRVERS